MKCTRNGTEIVFTFDGLDSVTFNADAATHLHTDAMLHGFEQKLRDTAAIARKQRDGSVLTVTEAMRREAVAAEAARLSAEGATWNQGSRTPTLNPKIAELAQKRGTSYAEALAWFNQKLMEELDA